MLKLEKLEVSGFKSFADRTELRFDEGITAVVGPNGCGKSNIADAIAWVLGEQSAKSLRSSKMEDVIFNGSRDRKPLGMAEVSLFFVATQDITDEDLIAAELAIPEPPVVEGLDPEAPTKQSAQGGGVLQAEGTPAPSDAEAQLPVAEREAAALEIPKHHRRHVYREAKPPKIAKGERVTLSRRLHRDGESDYLLNGKSCRLRDIQQLFAGTGLSGAHYAIVEQGDIDRVLSSKPQERRAIIEEAAGVSIFRIKKRAAELRLESSRQNLSRLNDIISEIERQIGSLKRQAARARRYRRLREQLRAVQMIVFRDEAQRLRAKLDALQERCVGITAELGTAEAKLLEREDLFAASNAQARGLESELDESRRALSALDVEIERSRSTSTQHAAEIEHARHRIAALEREQRTSTERFELVDRQADFVREQGRVLEEELTQERQRLNEMSAEYQRALDRLQMAEQEIEELRQQLYSAVTQLDRLQHETAQNEELLKKSELRRRQLQGENQRASERKADAASTYEAVSFEIAAEEQRLDELGRLRDERSVRLTEFQSSLASRQDAVASLSRHREALAHRLESLQDLDARHSFYNEAVQQVLSGANGRYTAIGTVADFVRVTPEYEEFVENFLGDILQCVLVPTTDDALGALAHLGGQSGGRATFLVAGLNGGDGPRVISIPIASGMGGMGGMGEGTAAAARRAEGIPASEILQIKPEIARIFEAAFPDEWNALMVATVERAIELSLNDPSRLYVSALGETVKCGRVIRGGNSKPTGKGLLALRREISELCVQSEACGAEFGRASELCEEARLAVEDLNAGIGRLTSDGQELERQLFENRVQAGHLQQEIERAGQQLRVVAQELDLLDAEDDEIRAEMGRASARMMELQSVHSEREAALRSERDHYQAAREAAAAQNEALSRLRAAVATTEERRRNLDADLRRLEDEHDALEQRISKFRFEELESRERIASLEAETVELAQRLEGLITEQHRQTVVTTGLSERLQSVREQTAALEGELKILRQQTSELKEQRGALEVERARHLAEAEYLQQSCQAELGFDLDTLLSEGLVRAGEDGEAAVIECAEGETPRSKLEETKRKLDELGPVNMVALEELVEAEERFTFLTTQRDDVLHSIDGTEKALAEIKRRSRHRFLESFEGINAGFKQSFAELFGGGRGEMMLLDQEDVLESGIEIIAQPPGKRLQNVLLLSGGEKALSAIALILAIFKYHPSPFCLMDEVDAALDEMNVGRFCDKIQQLTSETQFIVITHTKRTMEAARAIYGVTMEEPGVSKLLSVKFG